MDAGRRRSGLIAGLALACTAMMAGTTASASGASVVTNQASPAGVSAAGTSAVGNSPAGTAAHRGSKTFRVRGTQTPVDGTKDRYLMHSDRGHPGLVGKWRSTTLHWEFDAPWYFASGTEVFNGCLDINGDNACHREPSGRLTFDFVLWAKLDKNLREIEGGCIHPVTGGNGGFRGAGGLLKMRDFLVGDQLRTTYRGTITLKGKAHRHSLSEALSTAGAPAAAAAVGGSAATTGSQPFPGGC